MDQGRARALILGTALALAFAGGVHAEDDDPRFPVTFAGSVLYWNGGEFRGTSDDAPTVRPRVNPDIALKAAVDVRLAEHLSLGLAAMATAPREGARIPLAQVCGSLRLPFEVSREVAIEPGFELGWRLLQEARDDLGGSVQGLALDADVRLSVDKDLGVIPFCEFGFLAQPTGSNDHLTVVFSPTMFVGGGLQF